MPTHAEWAEAVFQEIINSSEGQPDATIQMVRSRLDWLREWLIEDGAASWADDEIPEAAMLPLIQMGAAVCKNPLAPKKEFDFGGALAMLRRVRSMRPAREPVRAQFF